MISNVVFLRTTNVPAVVFESTKYCVPYIKKIDKIGLYLKMPFIDVIMTRLRSSYYSTFI